jgi:ABC-type branched-subunit amino acid transport system substrate-binding protein
MPSATNYAAAYRARFSGTNPGVWGTFTYDSAKLLFRAMTEARTTSFEPVLGQLRATTNYLGATGPITIDPQTGNRPNVPVRILGVNASGNFVVLP